MHDFPTADFQRPLAGRHGGGADPEGDVALKLVHTADWHLGMTFPSFGADDQMRLMRARLDAVDRVLGLARHHAVDAVLCAGDLFDDADPAPEWWQGLSEKFREQGEPPFVVFLLPGNHDPLTETGVYSPEHPFRASLPDWVVVVDRDDFEHPFGDRAVLYAVPCRSRSESRDLSRSLPTRAPGDERLRVGMVHGVTFDLPGHQVNFPIARDAAESRGLDYLAIGDTHGFRDVTPNARAPMVYPGTPEPTRFGEEGAGQVALVYLPRDRGRRAIVRPHPVARFRWQSVCVATLAELEELASSDLSNHVLRLSLQMRVSVAELSQVERILARLKGNSAVHGRVGILDLDREGLVLDTEGALSSFEDVPDVLREAAERLKALESEDPTGERGELARRALFQLYRLTREAS